MRNCHVCVVPTAGIGNVAYLLSVALATVLLLLVVSAAATARVVIVGRHDVILISRKRSMAWRLGAEESEISRGGGGGVRFGSL